MSALSTENFLSDDTALDDILEDGYLSTGDWEESDDASSVPRLYARSQQQYPTTSTATPSTPESYAARHPWVTESAQSLHKVLAEARRKELMVWDLEQYGSLSADAKTRGQAVYNNLLVTLKEHPLERLQIPQFQYLANFGVWGDVSRCSGTFRMSLVRKLKLEGRSTQRVRTTSQELRLPYL